MLVHSTNSFNKDISNIRDKKLATKIGQIIEKMESANSIADVPGLKKMVGSSNAYRIRIGDFRLGFYLVENTIKLTIFANRKDIYKYFP